MHAPTIADTPAPDLTGLDQVRPPQMPDLDANVASAEGQRDTAMANVDTQIADVPQAPAPEADNKAAPQRNIGGLMAMSPWLIALSAFGGSRTKLSANNMLASTSGMINGLVSGDDQRYQDAYDKWKDEHKQFAEMQKQKWDIYKEMVKVYKDQIDGKQRALQVAEAAVRDARKDRSDAMSSYMQTVRASMALRDESRRWAALDEEIRSHKANEKQKAEDETDKNTRTSTKTGAKAKQHEEALSAADQQIDDLVKMLDAQATKGPGLGITGMGGMVKRGLETAGNVTGLSDETTAHDFESKLSNLQLAVAPLLASSRTAKDQREKIEKVVRGLKPGDTRQSTKSALLELKKQLQGLQPGQESGEHGPVVKEGTYKGKKVVQYEDGTVDYAQ